MELRGIRGSKAYPLLLAIALIALALRISTLRFELLLDSDPWYHYKLASTLLETREYPMWEYLTRYPFGEPVVAPPGFYYLPVIAYKILAFTGASFFRVFQTIPALMGFLSILPLYLLVRELFDRRIAAGAALLYAISPAALERSLAGFYRGDVFLVFTLLFALYFLLLGVKKNPRFAIPAGFFLFLGGLFWNGWPLAFLVFSLAAALGVLQNYIKGSSSATLVTSFGASSGLALVLLYLFRGSFYRYEPALKETWVLVLGFKLLLLAVLILALTSYLGVKLKDKRGLRLAVVAVIVIALGGAYSLGYVKPVSEYSRLLETTKGTALRETATYVWRTGITEQAKVSLEHLIYMYNILLLLAPLGLIYLFGRGRGAPFVLALVFATFPLLILQVRFIFLAAPALCILAALALPLFARKSLKSTLKRSAASVLLLLLLSLNTLAALTYASTARPFVGEALYDGLLWVSENTPEDAVILAWWDYSGPIVAIADRRSVAHTAPSGIMESFALLLRTSNETQAIEIFKSLNEDSALRDMRADYLIVDTRTYLLWPKILRFEPYVNYHVRVENRELADSMLHRLYVAKNLTRFELVYINTDFRLYRPLFNYTKIASIEASRYYKETPEFVVNVKSNERDRVILRMSISKEDRIVFQAEEEIDANSKYRLLLEEPPAKGRYVFTAELHSPAGVKLHTMSREFIII